MPEFLKLLAPTEALDLFLSNILINSKSERIQTQNALGRVINEEIFAPHPLPEFPRSTMDGYAVRAADTYGAGESLPAYLSVIGEVTMGCRPTFQLRQGDCAIIHTGGMIPQGSDAVVMVETTQTTREGEIEILRAVAVGENVIKIGEDIMPNDVVVSPGSILRPAELGALMAIGITEIAVTCRPIIGILSSGDEIIPPNHDPKPGQVRDINGTTLQALVKENGGTSVYFGIIPDSLSAMTEAVSMAKEACDLLVVTAGSSASKRDLTAIVLDQFGEPGVLVHGVNIRPGKPTILAVCDGKPMIGLPGNPVSALVIAGLFVVPVIKKILGETIERPRGTIQASLCINLSSQAGREDWVPVRLKKVRGGWYAEPVFGRSNLIFTLVGADGLLRIPPSVTGFSVGDLVEVLLF